MDPSVKDIPSLIRWLADKHHGGAASAMSKALGVSVSTPSFWRRGVVTPRLENLERICEVYGLKFEDVRALRRKGRRSALPIRGGSDGPGSPSVVQLVDSMSLIRRWLRELFRPLARPVLPLGCPA